MKKQTSNKSPKLKLDRQVVRVLTRQHLEVVAAGACNRDSTDTQLTHLLVGC